MVFQPPSWVPELPNDIPDSIPLHQFMQQEQYGRCPISKSRNPFTCGLTGKSYTTEDFFSRSEYLGRALAKRLDWTSSCEASPWDRVCCVFSLNSIDYLTACYGVHCLNGIVTTANAAYAAAELEHQLKSSGSSLLITCAPLLKVAEEAAKAAGLSRKNILLLDIPGAEKNESAGTITTVEQLIREGERLPALGPLTWADGQGKRQPAFLCYSSGTSGLPKAVMISHYNIISNVIQQKIFESVGRTKNNVQTQVISGFLPFSHIYALVAACHSGTYRGDEVIVLPRFEFTAFLRAIQKFKVELLFVVPPMMIQLLRAKEMCQNYDLSSVRFVFSGAAPLGEEVMNEVEKRFPTWKIGQAYGMTETAVLVTAQSEHDISRKTSGSLLPGIKAKIINADGLEIKEHDKSGELLIQSPALVLGYLNNEKATTETFVYHNDGRWIRTGDEGLISMTDSGNEHVVIVDRIKELIKVKGFQVAPAELEAHLLTHPAVADCAVIQVPDEAAGEVPKAFVVKASEFMAEPDTNVAAAVTSHVAEHKAHYKWLKGGVEFLEVIPKSPSGKILRRLLRDKEREARKTAGPRL